MDKTIKYLAIFSILILLSINALATQLDANGILNYYSKEYNYYAQSTSEDTLNANYFFNENNLLTGTINSTRKDDYTQYFDNVLSYLNKSNDLNASCFNGSCNITDEWSEVTSPPGGAGSGVRTSGTYLQVETKTVALTNALGNWEAGYNSCPPANQTTTEKIVCDSNIRVDQTTSWNCTINDASGNQNHNGNYFIQDYYTIDQAEYQAGCATCEDGTLDSWEYCDTNTDCETDELCQNCECIPAHTECNFGNLSCTKVPGAGTNQCTTFNNSCTKSACVNGSCVSVPGIGENTCSGNADCNPSFKRTKYPGDGSLSYDPDGSLIRIGTNLKSEFFTWHNVIFENIINEDLVDYEVGEYFTQTQKIKITNTDYQNPALGRVQNERYLPPYCHWSSTEIICTLNETNNCVKTSDGATCQNLIEGRITRLGDKIQAVDGAGAVLAEVILGTCPYDSICVTDIVNGTGFYFGSGGTSRGWNNAGPAPTNRTSCEIYEVCNPTLDKYIDEVENYCALTVSPTQDEVAYQICLMNEIELNVGERAQWMQGYWAQEIIFKEHAEALFLPSGISFETLTSDFCKVDPLDPRYGDDAYLNNKNTFFNKNLSELAYYSFNPPWISNSDYQLNSCLRNDLPASATLNVLKTGICADYSLVLTTLIRKMGFRDNEIYSATTNAGAHAYNLLANPLFNSQYYDVIDTTNNHPQNYATQSILTAHAQGLSSIFCTFNIKENDNLKTTATSADLERIPGCACWGGRIALSGRPESPYELSNICCSPGSDTTWAKNGQPYKCSPPSKKLVWGLGDYEESGSKATSISCELNEEANIIDGIPKKCVDPTGKIEVTPHDTSVQTVIYCDPDGTIEQSESGKFVKCCPQGKELYWGEYDTPYGKNSKATWAITTGCCDPNKEAYIDARGAALQCIVMLPYG